MSKCEFCEILFTASNEKALALAVPPSIPLGFVVHWLAGDWDPTRDDTYEVVALPREETIDRVEKFDPGTDSDFVAAFVDGIEDDIRSLDKTGQSLADYTRFFVNELRFSDPIDADLEDGEDAAKALPDSPLASLYI